MLSLKTRLGDMLVKAGIMNERQLETALSLQKTSFKRLGEILIELGYATEDDISEARALQTDMACINLDDITIPRAVIDAVPENIARTFQVIPISMSSDRISLAMNNPMDVEAIDAVQRHTRKMVVPVLSSKTAIENAINLCYGTLGETDILSSIEEAQSDIEIEHVEESYDIDDIAEQKRQSGQAPVIKTVNLILQEAVVQRASDIHFEPRTNGVEIRYRVDGALQHIRYLPKKIQSAVTSRIKIMAEMDIAEKRKPQDGRIGLKINNRSIDLRISSLPVQNGERIVIRILDKTNQNFSLEKVGFGEDQLALYKELINKPYGIILVTGPTGSGKTSTLYASIEDIKNPEINIMTCEDPVEYELEGIAQSAVNPKAGLTFASQLRAMLRQDPDVILVGEIRDMETATIAFQAAMTGHLIFSTLHCNDSASAITRLTDMGVEPFLIGSSLNGVIAQRLLKTLCSKCKQEYLPDKKSLEFLNISHLLDKVPFYKPVGCSYCMNKGYVGRTAVIELMPITDEMARLMIERPTSDQIREIAIRNGMKTLLVHATEKLISGITTIEEVRKRVYADTL